MEETKEIKPFEVTMEMINRLKGMTWFTERKSRKRHLLFIQVDLKEDGTALFIEQGIYFKNETLAAQYVLAYYELANNERLLNKEVMSVGLGGEEEIIKNIFGKGKYVVNTT